MRIVLEQRFVLGRFHATPWRVWVFDDPHGEWPPSPYRLLRAITARFHQLEREGVDVEPTAIDELVASFAQCEVSYRLPSGALRGPSIRQYQPDGSKGMPKWQPPQKKDQLKGAMRATGQYLAQDNCWAVPPTEPVYWILDGPSWTLASLALLDECLARMTYFGRAESLTEIRRVTDDVAERTQPNCKLDDTRRAGTAPVLCCLPEITREMVEADPARLLAADLPPGARWRFAQRPAKPVVRPHGPTRSYRPVRFVQFALGSKVPPPLFVATTMTNWFRGRVLRAAILELTGGTVSTWAKAPPDIKARLAHLAGKDADGVKLEGHVHARFGVWAEEATLTRLMVYRSTEFEEWEYKAILRAADSPLGWSPGRQDDWQAQLVPLDAAVPPPPGFYDGPHDRWVSVTPYVPPRFCRDSRNKTKKGQSVEDQVAWETRLRGLPPVQVDLVDSQAVWMRIHADRATTVQGGHTNNTRLAHWLRLRFEQPIEGPLTLGHSSFFGLGLFRPHP